MNLLRNYSVRAGFSALLLSFFTLAVNAQTPVDKGIFEKVDALLKTMTLEEKIGQMNQYNGFYDATGPAPKGGDAARKYEYLRKGYVGSMLNVRGVKEVKAVQKIAVEESRLGIPLIIGFDVIHGYKTMAPIPLAEAASWDMEAIRKSSEVAAAEAAAAGINWTFAPMVDISRDARWGRVMEGAGEDPFLGSHIAAARVRGFQGDDLSDPLTIAACAKHWAAYGFAEAGRDYNRSDIGTSTLYNVVFPPFKAAKEAGVKTFMNSFNTLNGVPATGDHFLQREILKGRWDFEGFIVSDWGSIKEMVAHGFAENGKEAALKAVKAGSDMDMESDLYVTELAALVREGQVDETLITDAARRILTVKYELGLFDDPYRYCDEKREKEVIYNKKYQDVVLDMARKSIVLLKNDSNLLPLKKEGQKIALIGALANDKSSPLGSWRIASDDGTAISVLEGMNNYKGNTLTYAKGADVVTGPATFYRELAINKTDRSAFAKAVKTAKDADVVVMVLGEHGYMSGEGRSRTTLDLPGVQQELLEAVYAVNENIVLVLNNGRPLAIDWAAEHIPTIVEGWHLGSQAGNAIAEVLYGDFNPAGKLPMSFPRSVGQVPVYYNVKSTGRPDNAGDNLVFWSHYGDEENTPLFPFGHGLSYATFEYSDMEVTPTKEGATVAVSIKNTGSVEGVEVVQLYMQDPFASVTRPVRELKGYRRVALKKGESKELSFKLTSKELGFYDNQGNWLFEAGEYHIFVGGNSSASLKKSFVRN